MSLPRLLRRVTPPAGVTDLPTGAGTGTFTAYQPAPDTVTIARATHEHRNARLRDLEQQLATAHARIIDLDHLCAEQLATIDAQDQTIRRAIRDLSASLQEQP